MIVDDHARERRVRDPANRLIVIGADDGNFLRHLHAHALGRFEKLLPEQIGRGHDADGLGQALEPRRQSTLLLLPAFRPAGARPRWGHQVNVARDPALLNRRAESLAPMLGPELALVFAETEMRYPALQQML